MAKKSTRTTDRTPADQQFHAVRMSETTFRSLPADLRTPRTGRGKTKPATAAKTTTKSTARTTAKTSTKVAGKTPAAATAQPATKTLGKTAKTAKAAGKTKRTK